MQTQVEVHLTSSAATANYCEIVSQLAPATNISFHDANWENYEDLLDPLGEANGPPISDNEVELQVLTQISTGENQLVFEGFDDFLKALPDGVDPCGENGEFHSFAFDGLMLNRPVEFTSCGTLSGKVSLVMRGLGNRKSSAVDSIFNFAVYDQRNFSTSIMSLSLSSICQYRTHRPSGETASPNKAPKALARSIRPNCVTWEVAKL